MLRKWSEYTNVLKIPASVVRDILIEKENLVEKKKLIRKQALESKNNQNEQE